MTTKGLYDDPAFLKNVREAYKKRREIWAVLLCITKPTHTRISQACWRGFKEGVEYGYGLDREEETD